MEYEEKLIQAVWEKARGLHEKDTTQWRKDRCGAWIQREHYNNQNSEFGWTIQVVSPGRPDDLKNLEPFHWKNTFDIANGKPQCRASADQSGLSPTQVVGEPRNNYD
jgi:hypothetical protein